MHLLSSLLLLLVVSRVFGQTLRRAFGQPEVVGEILAGIILGPALLNWIPPSAELAGIAELAVFLVIFSAGLEMEISEIFTAMRGSGLPIAIVGFLTPLVTGIGIGYLFDLNLFSAFALGLCLAITALPVALRLLETMNLMETRLGHNIVGAAVIIDIAALLMLGIVLDRPATANEVGQIGQVLKTIGLASLKMAVFFGLILGIDWIVTYRLKKNVFHRWLSQARLRFGSEALFGVAVLFVMLFSSFTETMGFHFVIGAFFGGMLLSRDFIGGEMYRDIHSTLTSISTGFLAPLFFAYIGLQFSTVAFDQPILLISILVLGIAAKTAGGALGAAVAKIPKAECLAVGVILNGRGVMDLVVAEIAYDRNLISQELFSALIMLGVTSTFLTPVLYRRLGLDRMKLTGQARDVSSPTNDA